MFPLSNINSEIVKKIKSYDNARTASELTSWIRVFCGAKKDGLNGLIVQSNTNSSLLRASGEGTPTLYGDPQSSGIMGVTWDGKVVESNSSRSLRPSPIITGFSLKEGEDQISRDGTLQLKAYTLEQMELIQRYFLEPGYSLFIEWGWNTPDGYGSLIKTRENGKSISAKKIVEDIANKNLNFDDLRKTRLNSKGQYDGYLAFIVGGNVSSDGDTFNIEVKLKGEPSIPTYLQGYRNSKSISANGVVSNFQKVKFLFSEENLTEDASPGESDVNRKILARRRFRYLFNQLPADKQIEPIKNLEYESWLSPNQFINFDKQVEKKIIETSSRGWFLGGDRKVEVEGIDIKKEDLFSKNKYVRMDLVVRILNTIGYLEGFNIGEKYISFQIDISDTVIGGFPNIFSTNPKKLIIPGQIPDFSVYFLNGESVEQKSDGYLNEIPPYNPDSSLIPFLGSTDLNGEYSEKAGYYGYLKYLFINFDIVKEALNRKIVNSREVFIDILNQISSAVNAFWKFQIIEGEFKERSKEEKTFPSPNPSDYLETTTPFIYKNRKKGDVIIKVVDENFIGDISPSVDKLLSKTTFQHNGIGSVFLNANLDISFPSSMVGAIVGERLGSSMNQDSPILPVTGEKSYFESDTDLFISARTPGYQPEQGIFGNLNSNEETSQQLQEEFDNNYKVVKVPLSNKVDIRKEGNVTVASFEKDSNGNITNIEYITPEGNSAYQQYTKLENKKKEENEKKQSNLKAYLNKLDVVPRSDYDTIFENDNKISDEDIVDSKWFKDKFAIHTFDDSDLFDLLKNKELREKYENGNGQSLSVLLPITYNFTILGNSGIRRGDVFLINGIPSKYKDKGFFQVIDIEHTLEGNKWLTQIGGKFRTRQ